MNIYMVLLNLIEFGIALYVTMRILILNIGVLIVITNLFNIKYILINLRI
jgi:hypothetical protein